MVYKCWVYVLKVLSTDSFYVGFTGNLEGRLDAHRKGRGHRVTSSGRLELVEVVECDNNTALEIERTKTLEYMEKYGEDRVVGYRFTLKKRSKPREDRPLVQEVQSIIHYGEDHGEYFRVCRECIHFDNPNHHCTLLDETTLGPNSCILWSSGLWGESFEEIEERATKMTESWFTPESVDTVRDLVGRRYPMYRILEGAFPELSNQKPYTAYMTQKELAYEFIFKSLCIPRDGNEWETLDRLQGKARN